MFWIFGIVYLLFAVDISAQVAKTKFSCDGHTSGYYADVGTGCQVYHMCDGLGRQFSYSCPNATLFQQRMLICDHWYMVNCSKSESDYGANLRIGQREMPFVDDSESNPYHRTPRPDLLSHPSESEYDIIYRTGRAQLSNNLNLVGAESDEKEAKGASTLEPAYSLPSHWSTEYPNQERTTSKQGTKKSIKRKPLSPAPTTESSFANYKSNFKATTPVFPSSVDVSSEAPTEVGLVPPLPYKKHEKEEISDDSSLQTSVNFDSNFKATTPVFPLTVDVSSEAPNKAGILPPLPYQKQINEASILGKVNFDSNFKATTPVYPLSVEATSVDPGTLGVLPPSGEESDKKNDDERSEKVPVLNLDFEPPAVDVNFRPESRQKEAFSVEKPSIFYQTPKFEPDYTEESETRGEFKKAEVKAMNVQGWKDLKKKFSVPDYDFPLESVSRPSYDSVFNSFQASLQ